MKRPLTCEALWLLAMGRYYPTQNRVGERPNKDWLGHLMCQGCDSHMAFLVDRGQFQGLVEGAEDKLLQLLAAWHGDRSPEQGV